MNGWQTQREGVSWVGKCSLLNTVYYVNCSIQNTQSMTVWEYVAQRLLPNYYLLGKVFTLRRKAAIENNPPTLILLAIELVS